MKKSNFKHLPAIIHAIIAGNEIKNVDDSKMLSNKIVNEQNIMFGDVSEWLYRGTNDITNVKKATTVFIEKNRKS